ncbi:SWIM zinc finger family protein [Intrasporangium calvum]|uniref:SWIM zinc finger family protein n=2 Tax=Intrasporangium calvum TaxID=53358 RepID=A0ABT5GLN8_9MICO|nr:SWIM zinc finger family protein [Intrasporangium calvum]MDC5699170.1 SWIM zinc finger family protein [Intrasporangium calvum]
MTRWTPQQVAALAPDAASVAASRRLARPGPWSDTGSTDTLVWGKCQGSGKTPYQVSVDLTGPAFRCSCPSRKFPCKHGLALLMLWVDGSGSVRDAAEPAGFAAAFAAERSARAAGSAAAREGQRERTPDPVAQAKRLEERLALMTGGMEDFSRWLGDVVRGGTAGVRAQPYGWWDTTAARLVDAQLPGLAEQVRSMASEVSGRPDWDEHLLAALGRWWTVTRAWTGRESADEATMGDLRAVIGWPVSSESVRRADSVSDRWTVLGAHRTDDGRLQQQRTWLHGERCGETVQVLDFAASGQVLPMARVVGSVLDATLARYPGKAVRRALFVDEPLVIEPSEPRPVLDGVDGLSVDAALGVAAATWGVNPWAWRVPVVLEDVRATAVETGPGSGALVDETGDGLRLTDDSPPWPLLALTGGHPTRVFVELEGRRARPLSAVVGDQLVAL